jgi:UDP-glucose 4-epimerase
VFGDGGQTRDLINIRDIVRKLIALRTSERRGKCSIFARALKSLLDLLDVFYELIPNSPQAEFAAPRAGDIYRSVGSPQKAKDVMGFEAQVSLVDGLKETVEWMRG